MKKLLLILLFLPIVVDAQVITTFAGNGGSGFSGMGGAATAASIGPTIYGCFDASGNYYFGSGMNRVCMVDNAGIIKTVAGSTTAGFSGDGGPATAAKINNQGATVDASGNIYIADFYNYRIRKVDASTHIITTIAGNGTAAFSGDSGPATAAMVMPSSPSIDRWGNLYFIDTGGVRIRKISSTGIISTVAGNGIGGFAGDGGPATAAELALTYGIGIDTIGNLYLGCDTKIRKVDISTGIISTYAGTGTIGFSGDGGPATAAEFTTYAIGMDPMRGNLYIADRFNDRVEQIDANGIFHLIAGTGVSGFSGDGGPATSSQLHDPEGVSADGCGNLYIADEMNFRIRKVSLSPTPCHDLSVDEQNVRPAVAIYPNPASTQLTITAPHKITHVTINSVLGRTLYNNRYNSSQVEVNVADLPAGVYLVRINGTDVRQFVKQ